MVTQCPVFFITAQVIDNKKDSSEIIISEIPTFDELNTEFTLASTGKHDPFKVIQKIASQKDNAVNSLELFLSPSIQESQDRSSCSIMNNNREFAILALEAIASPSSYKILKNAVQTNPSVEIKGIILRVFAWNMYYRTKNTTNEPDKEILYQLIRNADDTTYVPSIKKLVGEIAREGIRNWTGEDYGELPLEKVVIKSKKNGANIAIEEYREKWWKRNYKKIVWNKNTNHFEISNKTSK